jgi:hypothetical protein
LKDRLLQTPVLQTCLSLGALDWISSPGIGIWEPFLQSLVDVGTVIPGANALDMLHIGDFVT